MFKTKDLLYENPLAKPEDVADFVAEGSPVISFPMGAMRLENGMSADQGQAANYLFWCPEIFPPDFVATWQFKPIREPGLAMFWMSAAGRNGEDLFDPSLAKREGNYRQYHSGDINGYHVSYFRRKQEDERQFHTCNMRKSHGFHLVCQGADPIPDVSDVEAFYKIQVVKCRGRIVFSINDLVTFDWQDDGETYGPVLGDGRIGFRQMAPLIAEYKDLKIHAVESE